jgi:hypothetical protein
MSRDKDEPELADQAGAAKENVMMKNACPCVIEMLYAGGPYSPALPRYLPAHELSPVCACERQEKIRYRRLLASTLHLGPVNFRRESNRLRL